MINKNWRIIILFLTVFTFVLYSHPIYAEEPLTLEASIDIALKNSIVINIAKEGSKSATAQKREALTGFLPQFSTSYSYDSVEHSSLYEICRCSSAIKYAKRFGTNSRNSE